MKWIENDERKTPPFSSPKSAASFGAFPSPKNGKIVSFFALGNDPQIPSHFSLLKISPERLLGGWRKSVR
jgi:hypothetical protein